MAAYARGTVYKQLVDDLDKRYVRPINRAVGEGAFQTYKFATKKSQVDTGRLRSAWRLTLNRPSRSKPVEPSDNKRYNNTPGNDLFRGELMNATGQAKKSSTTFNLMKHKAIVISNNTSYIDLIDRMSKRNASSGKMFPRDIELQAEFMLNDNIQQNLNRI